MYSLTHVGVCIMYTRYRSDSSLIPTKTDYTVYICVMHQTANLTPNHSSNKLLTIVTYITNRLTRYALLYIYKHIDIHLHTLGKNS